MSLLVSSGGGGPITASDITDSSASGRTVLTGTPAEARLAIGAADANGSGIDGATAHSLSLSSVEKLLPKQINIFDHNTAVDNTLVSSTTGVTSVFSDSYATDFLPVVAGQVVRLSHGNGYSNQFGVAFYNASKDFLSGVAGPSLATTYTVPAGACYMRTCMSKTVVAKTLFMVTTGSDAPSSYVPFGSYTNFSKLDAHAVIQDIITRYIPYQCNLLDPQRVTSGKIIDSRTGSTPTVDGRFWLTDYMPVVAGGSVVLTRGNSLNSNYGLAFFDVSKQYIGGIDGPTLADTAYAVPAGAAFMRTSYDATTAENVQSMAYLTAIYQGSTVPSPRWRAYGIWSDYSYLKPYHGKVVSITGDSITQANVWQKNAAIALGFTIGWDGGVGGRTVLQATSDVVANASAIAASDLMLIALGTNDFGSNERTLGTLGDTSGTFYGDIEGLITAIYTANPTIRIGWIAPFRRYDSGKTDAWTNTYGYTLVQYVDAIKAVCSKYSIKVFDAYRESGLSSKNFQPGSAFTAEGLHLTVAGYAFVQNKINAFINGV